MRYIRVAFFDEGKKILTPNEEYILSLKELIKSNKEFGHTIPRNQLQEQGMIDLDLDKDNDRIYLDLLLKSDKIELWDGTYKKVDVAFKATEPNALWITVKK